MPKKAAGFFLFICFFLSPLWPQSEKNEFEGEPKAENNRFESEPRADDNRFEGEPRAQDDRFAGEPRAESHRFEGEPETWEAVLDIGQEKDEKRTEEKTETAPVARPKRDPRIKSRFFELSMANIDSLGFANNFIAVDDIMYNPFKILFNLRDIISDFKWSHLVRDEIEIDLDRLFKNGFVFDFGGGIKPLSININWKDKWGFGFDLLHIDATGNFLLPGEIISLKATDADFGVGAAVFADVGIPVFFHANELKVKFRPAVYVPLAYLEPDITYSYAGTRLDIKYNVRLYTPLKFSWDEQENISGIEFNGMNTVWDILNNNLGYDFNLGFEYPLYPEMLDIGIDFFNIPVPFLQAKLDNYLHLENGMWVDYGNIEIDKILSGEEEFDFNDLYYLPPDYYKVKKGSSSRSIFRPFKMIAYGIWQPFESKYFTVIPKIGFSINKLYVKPAAFEGGLGACFDINNCFITTLGIHYMDHKWKNSIDWILNLKLLQIDLGLIFQSQDFVQSWRGAGFALNFGMKLGF